MILNSNLDEPFRLLGIDPGTDKIGLAFCELDLSTNQLSFTQTHLLSASKRAQFDPFYDQLEKTHGARQARLILLSNLYREHLEEFKPHDVVCESPFIGFSNKGATSAFEALVQAVHSLRMCTYHYDRLLIFELISPMGAKKELGISSRHTEKSDVSKALELVMENPTEYRVKDTTALEKDISEHEKDAILIAYARFKHWLGELEIE